VGDLTIFKALTGGAFDRLKWKYGGEFDQKFSKKSSAPGFSQGGGLGGFGIDRFITSRNVFYIKECLNLFKNHD